MSTSYYAYAIIGVRVPYAKLFKRVQTRNCSHDFDTTDFAFCPRCGKRTWFFESEAIFDQNSDMLMGLHVVHCQDDEWAYLAPYQCHSRYGEDPCHLDIVTLARDMPTIHDECKAALEPFGLWHDDLFRLWAVVEVSY